MKYETTWVIQTFCFNGEKSNEHTRKKKILIYTWVQFLAVTYTFFGFIPFHFLKNNHK